MAFTLPENRLYHFCKLDIGLKHILPNKKLLMSPIINTNDPRENKSYTFNTIAWEGPIDSDKINQMNEYISRELRKDCKVLCFSQDYKDFFGYESSRMWAHYGDNHKGLCLELDREEFIQENLEVINPSLLKPINYYEFDIKKSIDTKAINYSLMRSLGTTDYLNTFRQEHLEYLYFTKNKEWESEQELRLIHFSTNTNNEYCSIAKSLKNIYLGVDFSERKLKKLIATSPTVDISKIKYSEVRLVANEIYKGI